MSLTGMQKKQKTRAKKQTGKKHNKPFPWAKLPAELRNEVYALCLTRAWPINLTTSKRMGRNIVRQKHIPRQNRTLVPNLLRIDKKTLAEGLPILYKNEFEFDDAKAMYVFLAQLSESTKSLLERISLNDQMALYGFGRRHAKRYLLLPALTGLIGTKALKILRFGGDFLGIGRHVSVAVQELYIHAHLWLEAVAREKGDAKAAVDLIQVGGHSWSSSFRDEFDTSLMKLLSTNTAI